MIRALSCGRGLMMKQIGNSTALSRGRRRNARKPLRRQHSRTMGVARTTAGVADGYPIRQHAQLATDFVGQCKPQTREDEGPHVKLEIVLRAVHPTESPLRIDPRGALCPGCPQDQIRRNSDRYQIEGRDRRWRVAVVNHLPSRMANLREVICIR